MGDQSSSNVAADGGGEESQQPPSVDVGALRAVLDAHPVRLAVLFGSQVTGDADAKSDVDLAIEFEVDVPDPTDAYLDLLANLSIELDRNDFDVALVDDLDASVGLSAFTHGERLLGSADRFEEHRERFERTAPSPSRSSLRERFEATLGDVDDLLDGRV